MRVLRVRFTLRRMMVAVAVVAMLLGAYRVVPSLQDIFRDDPYAAFNTLKQSWDAGPSPYITVDLFEGTVVVFPSVDDRISAEITRVAVTKLSQSDADEALAEIDLSVDQRGDTLRIAARGASQGRIRKETHVNLHVPRGVKLDLRTGRGEIRVGRDYAGKEFTALRDIAPGEEITVNYNGKPKSRSAVWFDVVEGTGPSGANGSVKGED